MDKVYFQCKYCFKQLIADRQCNTTQVIKRHLKVHHPNEPMFYYERPSDDELHNYFPFLKNKTRSKNQLRWKEKQLHMKYKELNEKSGGMLDIHTDHQYT